MSVMEQTPTDIGVYASVEALDDSGDSNENSDDIILVHPSNLPRPPEVLRYFYVAHPRPR